MTPSHSTVVQGQCRTLLFLMGPSSPFWRELAMAFEAQGHRTIKICFSLGDWLFWHRRGAIHYRGRLGRWGDCLEQVIKREGVTDILLYADQQPYHRIAGKVALKLGIPVFAIENGYLRPDWLTIERGGMGARSHFPTDPQLIRELARTMPEPDFSVEYQHGFWAEMVYEGTYHLISYFWRVFYPFYRSGRYYDPLLEMLVGIPKLMKQRRSEADAQEVIARNSRYGNSFFVTTLQLQGDYQVRSNSPYRHIGEMIEEVVVSFAQHAPVGTRLIFKQHPHDNGWNNWSGRIRKSATCHGVHDRVDFIDGGDLGLLLSHAKGAVMINSTAGLYSIRAGCPTRILGIAIYDMPGLTHQGSLDSFWNDPSPVDSMLATDFVKVLAGTIQVKGDFYDVNGRKRGISGIVNRVIDRQVNEPGAYTEPPPRLAKLKSYSKYC